jgi:hypothetical protein
VQLAEYAWDGSRGQKRENDGEGGDQGGPSINGFNDVDQYIEINQRQRQSTEPPLI